MKWGCNKCGNEDYCYYIDESCNDCGNKNGMKLYE